MAATINIEWPCNSVVSSRTCEIKVSKVLHCKGEWGRGRDLPRHRLDEIQSACDRNGMTLYQALSLRRSILRAKPGGMRRVQTSSAMGNDAGQREVAGLFENAIATFVQKALGGKKAASQMFRTEGQLLTEMREGTRERGPAPDLLFLEPVNINGQRVKWIDAKMCCGSAMLSGEKQIPNGKPQNIASRYNRHHGGNGAFVFGRGFCTDLRQIATGALLLDAAPLDMTAIEAFQDNQKH